MDILNWFKKPANGEDGGEATESLDLVSFTQQELAIVFKHSQTCPVSWAANRQVKEFSGLHPEVPLYTVIVQKERELSNRIAALTGVRHESPQILVFRRGQVVSDASHSDVTTQYLVNTTRG